MGDRILFVTHQLSRTGAPIVLLDMIGVCLKEGCNVEVISLLDGELKSEIEQMGINVTIKDDFVNDWDNFRKYAEQFHAVVANTLITYQVIHVLNNSNVPVIWWLHEGEQYFEYFKTVIPDFNRLGSNVHVYSVGHRVKDVVMKRYSFMTDILHMGVEDFHTDGSYAGKSVFEQYDSKHEKVRFLVVGTYSKLKAQDILAKAIEELDEEVRNQCVFLFCGNEEMYDEEVYTPVKSICEKYQNVHKIPSQSHDKVIELMEDMDYLLVPSRVDPIPTVAVEAMMMEKPCLITEVCGAAYYLKDGYNSLVFQSEDVTGLKEKICEGIRLSGDRDAYDGMGKAARCIYEEHFSKKIFEEKVKDILMLNGKNGKLIFMTGLYDILDIFTYELMKEYQLMGYEVMEFDSSHMKESLGKLYDFIKTPVKAVITFNNLGYNMELVQGSNLWEQLQIPVINILMDHPFCHKAALDASPSNGIVLCVDRNHMAYLQRFYQNIPIVGFLPHGGKKKYTSYKPITERSLDVLYAGGISRGFAHNMIPDFSKMGFDAKAVADEAYDDMINNPYKTTEDAIEQALIRRNIHLKDSELCDVIEKLHYVDLLIVSYYRERVIKTLVESGVKVTLYGTGWEVCDWIDNPNLDYRGRVSAEEVVDSMQDAKIVLSTMTWFKDGTHDRVFNGMLAGAVAVTDSSIYMKEEFTGTVDEGKPDNRQLVMFELEEIDKLPDTVKELLGNHQTMQQIADRGYETAVQKHTWQSRAHELEEGLLSQL